MIRIGVRSFVAGGGYTPSDADALAFINAAGITDDTQKLAVNTLVTDLKGYSIWDKMKAIYPFVGGTSSTHKWNLKDPRDLDAAFRLVFNGGWTHGSTGATPNGTNGYADTFLVPNNAISSQNSNHLSYYSRTSNAATTGIDIGSLNTSPASYFHSHIYYSEVGGLNDRYFMLLAQSSVNSVSNLNSLGFFNGNRKNSTTISHFKNGSNLGDLTSTSVALNNRKVYIGAGDINGTANNFSNRECAFASIGDGLTDTEAANFYTAVQAYQTTLSRNV